MRLKKLTTEFKLGTLFVVGCREVLVSKNLHLSTLKPSTTPSKGRFSASLDSPIKISCRYSDRLGIPGLDSETKTVLSFRMDISPLLIATCQNANWLTTIAFAAIAEYWTPFRSMRNSTSVVLPTCAKEIWLVWGAETESAKSKMCWEPCGCAVGVPSWSNRA